MQLSNYTPINIHRAKQRAESLVLRAVCADYHARALLMYPGSVITVMSITAPLSTKTSFSLMRPRQPG